MNQTRLPVNDYFLSDEFVQIHLAQTDAIPRSIFRLTFVEREWGRTLTAPRVLDIGCGGGHASQAFDEAFTEFSYVGLDFSAPMLRQAWRRHSAFSFVRARFDRTLPFADGSFDLVYFRDFLIHVQHPYDLIAEALRVSSRFVAFNVPTVKIDRDLELTKVRSLIRYNFLSWTRLLSFLRSRGELRVKAAAFKNRGYDPPDYASKDGRPWVESVDRAGGAKDVDLLIDKQGGRFSIEDRTRSWRHRGFVGAQSAASAMAGVVSGGFYPHRVPQAARRVVRGLIGKLK
jgi:SAM-dependent methyltransferase